LSFGSDTSTDAPVADSQALTSVDIEALQSAIPQSPVPAAEQTTNSFEDDDFDGVEAALAAASSFSPEHDQSDPFSELPRESDADLEAALQNAAVSSEQATQGRQPPAASAQRKLYLLGGLAASICLMSVVLLFLFLRTMRTEPQIVQADPKLAAPADVVGNQAADNAANNAAVPANPQADQTAKATEPNDGGTDTPPVADPSSVTETGTATEKDKITDASQTVTPVPEPPADSAEERLKILLQPKIELPANPTEQPDAPPVSDDVPEELKKYGKLFDFGQQTLPDAKILPPDEVDGVDAIAEQSEIGVLYHPDPAPLPNWEDLKGTPVVALDIPELPLLEVLTTLESIYGAPCSWDVNAVALQPIDFEKRVTKKYRNTTLEAVYLELLNDYGLTLNARPEALPRIVPSKESMAQVPGDIAISDFGGNANGDAWLTFFQDLFVDAKDQMSLEGDRIVFGDAMTLTVRHQIAELATQIQRVIQASGTGGQQLTALQSNELGATVQALQKVGKVAFARRTTAALALTQAAQEVDLPLMIDWDACWQHGLTPHVDTAFLTRNRTFAQISRFVVDEYALAVVIDPLGRLVLTTPPAQRQMVQYRVVSMPDSTTVDTLRKSLLPLWLKGADGKSKLQIQMLPGDQKPTFAVVRICAPALTQLNDSSLLGALNVELPN
jgi:hypothetical protein